MIAKKLEDIARPIREMMERNRQLEAIKQSDSTSYRQKVEAVAEQILMKKRINGRS